MLLRHPAAARPVALSGSAEPRLRQPASRAARRLPVGLGERRCVLRAAYALAQGRVPAEDPHDGARSRDARLPRRSHESIALWAVRLDAREPQALSVARVPAVAARGARA